MVGCCYLNTIQGVWGHKPPIYHMLHEQTVPWCLVKCKCPSHLYNSHFHFLFHLECEHCTSTKKSNQEMSACIRLCVCLTCWTCGSSRNCGKSEKVPSISCTSKLINGILTVGSFKFQIVQYLIVSHMFPNHEFGVVYLTL